MLHFNGRVLQDSVAPLQDPTVAGAAVANAGTYTVTATDPIAGCSATATTNVVVNALPNANASSNSPVCARTLN